MKKSLYFLILFIFLNSCIAKKEISTPIIDCIPSDSCTFSFKITETFGELPEPSAFFMITLIPRQGIACRTNFDGECELTIKRPLNNNSLGFIFATYGATDTISIKLDNCEDYYYTYYDFPEWFKDSISAMPPIKLPPNRSPAQMQTK